MKKINKTPIAVAVGSAVAATFTTSIASAEVNPFSMSELSGGYMQLAENDKAGEMKCGAGMGKKEGTCGEGKCGAMMGETKVKEGKCAGNKSKKDTSAEGKCGEGKCGEMMDGEKMKKGKEGKCGEMMKGKEGSCGDKVDPKKAGGSAQ